MVQSMKNARLALLVTTIAVIISDIVLCLIPLTQNLENTQKSALIYIIASAFWLSWIIVGLCTVLLKKTLNPIYTRMIEKKVIETQKKPGIISFSIKRRQNLILYAAIAVGLILIITDILIGYTPEKIMFPILSLTVSMIVLHSVIDGKYYKVYKLLKENVKDDANHAQ